ncbi:hypothetical protein BKA70DRAFT_1097523 [Coprinopsis sp. MPI-PUGE-AT-0042]|nr:hypothetical protein BKA70DRAFT_1097523 [Coprinopsis sp. MPI-PUGE-AT-0042]
MLFPPHAAHLSVTVVLSLSLLASQASAATICAWTKLNCTGLFGCCTRVDERECCTWRTGRSLGWSVSMSRVSAPGHWTAFTSVDRNCTRANGSASGEGPKDTVCLDIPDFPDAKNYGSGYWISSPLAEKRENEGKTRGVCHTPDIVGYQEHDGRKHTFKVPEGDGQFEFISQLVESKDFEALSAFEHV